MKQDQKIFILDTTLRDGQQSPGAGMSFEDNLQYAALANDLGIDVLEAGFPAASQQDFEIVQAISCNMAQIRSRMVISALCQLREQQIIRTMSALQPSHALGKARIHTYVPVDPNLMQASLRQYANDYQKIIDDVYRLVKLAVEAGFEVEFSPEGYSRMQHHFDFTTEIIRSAVQAGASIINCPDTIGGASRFQGSDFFVNQMQKHAAIIKQEFPTIDVIWSTHCHNDLGLAVDNSLTAVFSGPARQIEGCINGVGERAGNASLEQCILLIDLFGQQVSAEFNYFTEIKLERLTAISNFVAERMLVRQPHWPITGENAARHSSGGHTNAILKNPMAYQPFEPSKVGNKISFVFGPLSGSNHAKNILEQNGFICPPETKTAIAEAIKNRYQDRRKGITDEELVEGYKEYFAPIKMTHINYSKDHQDKARLEIEGEFFSEQNIVVDCDGGNSALAALDKAVKQFVPGIEIIDYRSNACGNTVNAKCSATVIVSIEAGEHYMGKAVDADITIAAMKAYVNAVNLAYVHCYYRIKEEVYV